MFDPAAIAAFKADAIRRYPEEACGAITPHGYVSLRNLHPDPRNFFNCRDAAAALLMDGDLLALVHSHPDGVEAPSFQDIAGQRAMDVPWGILTCDAEDATEPFFWGDTLEPPPLLGRQFRHGPSGTDGKGDCGALVRDWFRYERGIAIPDFPREDAWWKTPGRDYYAEHFTAAGFKQVGFEDVQVGDVFLMRVGTPADNPVCNHAAIYIGNGDLMHHLSNRLSRVEPVLHWRKFVQTCLRHRELSDAV